MTKPRKNATTRGYGRREAKRRYPAWALKCCFSHGPGKWWKSRWARDVRRIHKQELRSPDNGFTPMSRIGSNWDWC